MYIWPSAPMLKSFIRNAAAAARPVKASGVATIRVWSSDPVCEERRVEELAVGRERIVPGDEEHEPGDDEGEERPSRPGPQPRASVAGAASVQT